MNVRARVTALFLFFIASASTFPGCKPKPGGKCQAGQAACEDSSTVLACDGEVFAEAKCRGAAGCAKNGAKVTCDQSTAQEGDACVAQDADARACSVDKRSALACVNGKFAIVEACDGPNGCTPKGAKPACDATLAKKGDACARAGDSACGLDQKSRLLCTAGKWMLDRYCRGPKGCMLPSFGCDEEISDVGDPCGNPGYLACGLDHATELVCQGGQFVRSRACPGLPLERDARRLRDDVSALT